MRAFILLLFFIVAAQAVTGDTAYEVPRELADQITHTLKTANKTATIRPRGTQWKR